MSSIDKNLSISISEIPTITNAKIGIVTAEWNHEITSSMHQACISELMRYGIAIEDIHSVTVPGTFELPSAAKLLLSNEKLDAVICIGCVIKGETKHDEYISNAVANGIMQLSVLSGKPVIFGVLTPNNMEQALDRAGGKHGNKGIEAAHTALKMIRLSQDIKNTQKHRIGY